jgi:hypothetical protein
LPAAGQSAFPEQTLGQGGIAGGEFGQPFGQPGHALGVQDGEQVRIGVQFPGGLDPGQRGGDRVPARTAPRRRR